ncbi:MOSC domain-containing protein [Herbiconiux sp.]|uniref:MOSC domain-containing protein n=1 Tax=Herbiconiux sp. TaxID=1871186 RepID=UPI0025C68E9E|nr:MOSC domain-containing protein [Herbiconiux sp.]
MTQRELGASLARITRFPVKGLPGVSTHRARITPGEGLPFDRVLAIETGAAAPVDAGGWRPRAVFHHLAKNPELVLFETSLAGDGPGAADPHAGLDEPGASVLLRIRNPAGAEARIRFPEVDLDEANGEIGSWFAPGGHGAASVTAPSVRMWDWPKALISLINLESVAALAASTGRPVDPRRFRGNLLVQGLPPWSEFGLVGSTIAIGEVLFDVFQPTDRCRATTVDPATGVVDLNVPAALASRLGHMYCGVYLRPRSAGSIAVGAPITVVTGAPDAVTGAPWPDAPALHPEETWPRLARVTGRADETADAVSLWLEDSVGLLCRAAAGQHVRLHFPGEAAPNWRNYTISRIEPGRVRITVRRASTLSRTVHETLHEGSEVLVSGPFGRVQFAPAESEPVVLLSAGIGITPTIAILRALAAAGSTRPVAVLHVDRADDDVALRAELIELVETLPDARLTLHLTGEGVARSESARLTVRAGRPSPGQIAELAIRLSGGAGVRLDPVSAFVCGPAPFLDAARDALEGAGVHRSRIHFDVFYTPVLPDPEPKQPPLPGPFTVGFGREGGAATWKADSGSLLDVAEAAGQDWPSACRSGACGTCERFLASGTVAYLTEPVIRPADGRILTCCAVPTSDVVLPGDAEAATTDAATEFETTPEGASA